MKKIKHFLWKLKMNILDLINKMSIGARKYRKQNHNKDLTIITRDCIGGFMYHQLKLQFLSPTINLYFSPIDFNLFVIHLKDYLDGQFIEVKEEGQEFPIGLLYPKGDLPPIKVNFMHYKTFDIAVSKWNSRAKRINWNNIYVVNTFYITEDVECLSEQLIEDWAKIPYKKVIFVDKSYGFENEFIVSKPKKIKAPAWVLYPVHKLVTWKKRYNEFDVIKFFNE